MANKGYYYNKVKELVEREFCIDMLIIEDDLEDLEGVALYLVEQLETLDTETDAEADKERDQLTREVFQYLRKEHKAEIKHAQRVKRLFEVMTECPQVMETYNNNPWDLLEELNDYTTNRELTTLERFFIEREGF